MAREREQRKKLVEAVSKGIADVVGSNWRELMPLTAKAIDSILPENLCDECAAVLTEEDRRVHPIAGEPLCSKCYARNKAECQGDESIGAMFPPE